MTTRDLRAELLDVFKTVMHKPFVGYEPDDWRNDCPQSFTCSSFAQWIALKCLGWGEQEKTEMHPPRARRYSNDEWSPFPQIPSDEAEPGDLCIYADQLEYPDAFHCMIYIGEDEVIGACETAQRLVQRNVYYSPDEWSLIYIRRIAIHERMRSTTG